MKKKLIEVAMPLDAINAAAIREKSPFLRGHPRSLHVWWARRPLAACRAVLFASIVNDPSSDPSRFPTAEHQERERARLLGLLERLSTWEGSRDPGLLADAQREINAATGDAPPPILDPFCGGGSIPLEAMRLGLDAYGSDLNPVAVLITRALSEIPARLAGHRPVNPGAPESMPVERSHCVGLSSDLRYYGALVTERVARMHAELYGSVGPVGSQPRRVPVAWIWARTVTCPNPACRTTIPLVTSFLLSKKSGREAWVTPGRNGRGELHFEVLREGSPPKPTKIGRGARFRCLACETVTEDAYVKAEGGAGRLGTELLAAVVDTGKAREFVPPDQVDQPPPGSLPDLEWLDQPMPLNPRWFSPPAFGLSTYRELFTWRQLTIMSAVADAIRDIQAEVRSDAIVAGLRDDGVGLAAGGSGAAAYAEAIRMYLSLALSRFADFSNAICSWDAGNTNLRQLFSRQAIPMTWDFVETNVLSGVVSFSTAVGWAASALESLRLTGGGRIEQLDAAHATVNVAEPLICTDPPYYDNIGYADLSDFFYVWQRRCLDDVFPDLYSTLLTPKAPELVATPYRFDGDRDRARAHFERGMTEAFERLRAVENPEYPLTLFYAFKQAEATSAGVVSTGWETMLQGLLGSGLMVTATWPMRTEQAQRSVASGTNALASSIVIACRSRPVDARLATRREFTAGLREEIPTAVRVLQAGNTAPVDLAQAAIGPGMAVFSRFAKVVEADGSTMSVRSALGLINQVLDEQLAQQDVAFDPETRWAVSWFEQFGMDEGPFGVAETLCTARNVALNGLLHAGIVVASAGKVRLLGRPELDTAWNPATDTRLTIWEIVQHIIRLMEQSGELAAAGLLGHVGGMGDVAKELAYRLFVVCERKAWTEDAVHYNALVKSWPELVRLAAVTQQGEQQRMEY